MAIDILSLEPTTISRNLKGKYMLVYGAPKVLGTNKVIYQLNSSKNWNPKSKDMGIRAEVII